MFRTWRWYREASAAEAEARGIEGEGGKGRIFTCGKAEGAVEQDSELRAPFAGVKEELEDAG